MTNTERCDFVSSHKVNEWPKEVFEISNGMLSIFGRYKNDNILNLKPSVVVGYEQYTTVDIVTLAHDVSRGEAKEKLKQGAVKFNGVKVNLATDVSTIPLLHDAFLVVEFGKYNFDFIEFEDWYTDYTPPKLPWYKQLWNKLIAICK